MQPARMPQLLRMSGQVEPALLDVPRKGQEQVLGKHHHLQKGSSPHHLQFQRGRSLQRQRGSLTLLPARYQAWLAPVLRKQAPQSQQQSLHRR